MNTTYHKPVYIGHNGKKWSKIIKQTHLLSLAPNDKFCFAHYA